MKVCHLLPGKWSDLFVTNPQPVFPACVCAPGPEQIPDGPAQHPLAQSLASRHCPPINCWPFPFPTFFVPAGSNGGPPTNAPGAAVVGAAVVGGASDVASAGAEAPVVKPQPCLPCWNAAPGPEQMPVGKAQQPLPQSASERHWPVMNCSPFPFPT